MTNREAIICLRTIRTTHISLERQGINSDVPIDEDDMQALNMAISALSSSPESKKGEWIVREDNTSFVKQIPRRWVECSCCGWTFSYDRIRDNFCPNCGTDLRGGADENTH